MRFTHRLATWLLVALGVLALAWFLVPRQPPLTAAARPDEGQNTRPRVGEGALPADDPDDPDFAPVIPPVPFEGLPLNALWAADLKTPIEISVDEMFPPIIWCFESPLPKPDPSPRPRPLQVVTRWSGELRYRRAEEALAWLSRQVRPHGGWAFVGHEPLGPEAGAGPRQSATGATGLAMLPFLAVGHTHKAGPYQDVMQRGVDRLLAERADNLKAGRHAGDLRGTGEWLVSQAWATSALCGSYAHSRDPALRDAAQDALRFLISLQRQDGSWSAQPDQPGDCLATVWAILALRDGHFAYLDVRREAIRDASQLLVQNGRLRRLARPAGRERACQAGELVCEACLARNEDPALVRRMADVLAAGPAANDVECNLFATELAWHAGGNHWKAWNAAMEDQLFRAQVQAGEDQGSWHTPEGSVSAWGGRLGETALQTLILMKSLTWHLSWRQRHGAEDF